MMRGVEGGHSEREHLAAAARLGATTAAAKLAEVPDAPPDVLAYLWGWYVELAMTRSAGFAGADPLTYREIEAWSQLTDRRPRPHEVQALMTMDAVARMTMARDREERQRHAGRAQSRKP